MGKFVIENVLIEKSDKDIKTGLKYEFTDGFNVVCGNNETGKSSLMAFIKNGFFKNKNMDCGKIYFSIPEENKKYRADISGNKAVKDRCKIYDSDNSSCDYSILQKYIDQKYFEEGFTINLDDLMKIQNNDTSSFVNIIKDPSGDKLNVHLENINKNISSIVTSEGRLKKEVKDIISNINDLNTKINSLSSNEDKYFDAINKIKKIDVQIENINNTEEYLKTKKELNYLLENLKKLNDEKSQLSVSYNEKLTLNKERYIELIQQAGSYSYNLDSITKNLEKINNTNFKISEEKARLLSEAGFELSDEEINNFVIDYEQISKLKDLSAQINEINDNIKTNNLKVEDIENTLLNLKYMIKEDFDFDKTNSEVKHLEEVISLINEGLSQYHFLTEEIGNEVKYDIINAGANSRNNKLQLLLVILGVVTIICAVVSFYQHIQTAGIFSILMAVLSLAGYSSLKLGTYIENQDEDKQKKIEQRKALISTLKTQVQEFFPEIDNVESSYFSFKIEKIEQELKAKVSELKLLIDNFNTNENTKKYNLERKQVLIENNLKLSSDLDILNKEVSSLIEMNISDKNISLKKYLEIIEIIKNLKNEFENKQSYIQEKEDAEKINKEIYTSIKDFILENDINIVVSEDFVETLNCLKQFYAENTKLKDSIGAINAGIDTINKQIEQFHDSKKETYSEFDNLLDVEIEEKIQELKDEKTLKLEEKKNLEFQKRDCEKYEGILNLKTEKNVLLTKYQTKIKSLLINQMVLDLVSKAKEDFDKTQPDLINAQKYLSILTDGKYSKINLDMQEVESEDGVNIKSWETLSRGTKEQLYFALRLGYAANYSKDKVTLEPNGRQDLPLIVDDAFVNFDVVRTINALKCLKEFSKTNQVFFFTCHKEETLKQLEQLGLNENKDLNVINL